jgi:hypothetical protein
MNSFTACLKSPQSQQKLETNQPPYSYFKRWSKHISFRNGRDNSHAARKSLKIKKTKFRNIINNVCNKK